MANTIKPEIDGIIISGKVYDVLAEESERSCEGCSLYGVTEPCGMNFYCTKLKCIFRYSSSLTERLNNNILNGR